MYHKLTPLLPNYPLLLPDFRGWGSSTDPSNDPIQYSITQLASDVENLIHHLKITDFVLVGHSMGGKVTQLIASHQPAGLKALILLASAPTTPLHLPPDMKEQQIHAYDSIKSVEFVIRNVLNSPTSPLSDDEIHHIAVGSVSGNPAAKIAWLKYGLCEEDVSADIGKIKVPVLVVAAAEDRVETVKRVVGRLGVDRAEMVVIEGSGHLLPLEAPDHIAKRVKEFLDRVLA
ncbi:hypothetical protein JAAARDRAFT_139221 [Jaapia argillacea MUCL 33604]|uniref:AB hydrolase-1 domain-containing protein n=1 Tax=Jaapia argillacea MUCL 33604 TaxID=933084 RepID=A0A067PE43_9AGAM|nr:hypothetical protein JAAARDRAFT_139221 [Jaapia argillacea MUCL 33604]